MNLDKAQGLSGLRAERMGRCGDKSWSKEKEITTLFVIFSLSLVSLENPYPVLSFWENSI